MPRMGMAQIAVLCACLALLPLPLMAADETEYVFTADVIPERLNDELPLTIPAPTLDTTASLVRFAVQWPTTDEPLIGRSAKRYFAVARSRRINNVLDEYVESEQSTDVVYGHRYFFNREPTGLNLGWYAGVSFWSSAGYDYYGSSLSSPYQEQGSNGLVAFELSYDLRIPFGSALDLVIIPSMAAGIDKSTGRVTTVPLVEIGFAVR